MKQSLVEKMEKTPGTGLSAAIETYVLKWFTPTLSSPSFKEQTTSKREFFNLSYFFMEEKRV